jgi:hypothetical protein
MAEKTRAELEQERWISNDLGIVWASTNHIEGMLKEYFNVQENLREGFSRRSQGGVLEVRADDASRGYVFTGPSKCKPNFEEEMQRVRREYSDAGKQIVRYFADLDKQKQVAGFSWRKGK